jgi:aspartokinase-like uncharacterized kinase
LAEDFNDWGSYRRELENEEFAKRPLIRKIFSFRSFKLALKGLGYLLVFMVFAILFWRIISSKLPSSASKLIWTENSYTAYKEKGNDLLIYTQDVGKVFDKDGKFSLYELHYIPAAKEIQFTIRYNKSTVDTLASELTEELMDIMGESFTEADIITADMLPELPFTFKLRDNEGNIYNINADTAASKIAGMLKAESLISMTDISGILRDKNDPSSLISKITTEEASKLIEDGTINGGMIPKVECCIESIKIAVEKVFIIDGTVPHAIVIELLTDEGIGTMFAKV